MPTKARAALTIPAMSPPERPLLEDEEGEEEDVRGEDWDGEVGVRDEEGLPMSGIFVDADGEGVVVVVVAAMLFGLLVGDVETMMTEGDVAAGLLRDAVRLRKTPTSVNYQRDTCQFMARKLLYIVVGFGRAYWRIGRRRRQPRGIDLKHRRASSHKCEP
jgi:hypothetical protein